VTKADHGSGQLALAGSRGLAHCGANWMPSADGTGQCILFAHRESHLGEERGKVRVGLRVRVQLGLQVVCVQALTGWLSRKVAPPMRKNVKADESHRPRVQAHVWLQPRVRAIACATNKRWLKPRFSFDRTDPSSQG
jgi:hypothetical protein